MAFFKTRKPAKEQAAAPVPAQSIEIMRRRAKHRLIGAAVLVLAGVVGFPLLFDSQPRPVAVDIPIEIPDKGKVKPLVLGAVPAAEPAPAAAPEPQASAAAQAVAEVKEDPKPVAATPLAAPKPSPAPAATVAPKAAAAADDGAKARALLDAQETPAGAATAQRYVVQVGAFTDATKLREVRQKLEKAGLKTYTQVVDSKEGKRTRVRVGPFASQAEADKVATRIKALALSASVLKM